MGAKWVAAITAEDPEPVGRADLRIFPPGLFSWMQMPLTAHVMTVLADGHDGAEVAARTDAMKRVAVADAAALFPELEFSPTAEVAVVAFGEFDNGEAGIEAERLVRDRVLRRVSVQPRNVAAEWDCIRTGIDEETGDEWCELGAVRFLAYQIAGFSILDSPGVESTDIRIASDDDEAVFEALADLGQGEGLPFTEGAEPLTASTGLAAQLTPPGAYFPEPDVGPGLTAYTRVQVLAADADGWMRIVGHVAPHTPESQAQCHVDYPDECKVAPVSPTEYGNFLAGIGIPLDDGRMIHPGVVTMSGSHAPLFDRHGQPLSASAALAAYSDQDQVVAYVTSGDDEHGWWISGVIRPDLAPERLLALQAGKLSGDWRWIPGVGLDAIAVHVVNTPGFFAPARPQMMVASLGGEDRVVGLITAGQQMLCRGDTTVTAAPEDRIASLELALLDEIHDRILGDDQTRLDRLARTMRR